VQGIAQSGYGVGGYSGGVGVYGLSSGSYAIVGVTTAGNPYSGITGSADTPGAAAFAGGTSTPGCYAAYFTGPVVIDGDFTVVDPARKHGAIKHPDGSYRLLYSMESPESWLEDFGKGQLVNGKADVRLDADFAAIATTGDYHVFLTMYDAAQLLFVGYRTAAGFTVQAERGYDRCVLLPGSSEAQERCKSDTSREVHDAAHHDPHQERSAEAARSAQVASSAGPRDDRWPASADTAATLRIERDRAERDPTTRERGTEHCPDPRAARSATRTAAAAVTRAETLSHVPGRHVRPLGCPLSAGRIDVRPPVPTRASA
jgi:hypothetical protein